MRVEDLGNGEPEIVILCGIHGDEPEGPEAVEMLKQKIEKGELDIRKPVRTVIVNEKALKKGERYIDTDLNRSYPGNPDSELLEERLAAEVVDLVEGKIVVDLHTTASNKSFVIVTDENEETLENASFTGFDKVVNFGYVADSVIPNTVKVSPEVARGENAVDELYDTILNFLRCHDVLEGICHTDQDLFRINGKVDGAGYEFLGENFVQIKEGEVFAKKEDDEIRAEKDFYPVLMSTDGYDEMVGFMSEKAN